MRLRVEPFGSWARITSPPALVKLDRAATRRLGVEGGARWSDEGANVPSPPIEVHMAVTSRCGAGCTGCYLDATPDGESPPFDVLAARLDVLARAGVFVVAFGGGEPLSRPDLGALAEHAKRRGLSPVMTTSGIGLTAARAEELRAFEQVNVSYDGVGDTYADVRGWDGARVAEKAITLLRDAAVRVGVNVVLTRKSFDRTEETALRARELGASETQLLRFKPAGRGVGLEYLAAKLTDAQARSVYRLLERMVATHGLSVRIDCAMIPFLSPHLASGEELTRWGVLGCEAGRHLLAARIDGGLSPCSFSAASPARVEDIARAMSEDVDIVRHREHSSRAPEPCASCALRESCRGGCRVVAAHAGDASAPDPECPRVIDHAARKADVALAQA